jgi:mercuric ion transport protein
MRDPALIAAALAGAVAAAVCCAAPFLAMALAAFGLTAWLAKIAYAVIPAVVVCVGLVALFLAYRLHWRHTTQIVVHPHRMIRKTSHEQLLRDAGR